MDIEEIKRINRMTAELKKHGMAESSVDAYHQARASFEEPQERSQQIIIEQQPTDNITERKFELLIELNNKKFQEALTILSNDIALLAQQLANLKQEVQQNKASIHLEQKQEKQQSLPKQEAHPRQGMYSPADVSIEKMFYFGKK